MGNHIESYQMGAVGRRQGSSEDCRSYRGARERQNSENILALGTLSLLVVVETSDSFPGSVQAGIA